MARGVSRFPARLGLSLWYGGLVVGGFVLVWTATPWGIGVRHDSLAYLTAAQSLLQGGCLCWIGSGLLAKPLVHFGPLYPLLLSGVTLLSQDLLVSARWIAATLYGVNLALWGAMVHIHVRRFWAGAWVSLVLATSMSMIQIHDAAMSEPLFLALLALALTALADFLTSGRRWTLYFSAGAVSLAALTRYAAGGLIGLGVLAILFLAPSPRRQRLGDALRFGLAAGLPLVLWSLRNRIVAGTATNRVLRWHPITIDDLRTFLRLLTAWFVDGAYSHWLEGAVLVGWVGLVVVFLWWCRNKVWGQGAGPNLGFVLVGLVTLYPLSIGAARSLFDATIPIDDRMFSPLFVALVALGGVVVALALRLRPSRWFVLPVLILFLLVSWPHAIQRFQGQYLEMRRDGVLFSSRAWRESPSVAWVRSLPADSVIYTNQALALQFLTGKKAYQIPDGFDPVRNERRPDFDSQVAQMQEDLQQPGAFLLIFNPSAPSSSSDVPDEFKAGMSVVKRTSDGFVMRAEPTGGLP